MALAGSATPPADAATRHKASRQAAAAQFDLQLKPGTDVTQRLQRAIDRLAPSGTVIHLPPGRFSLGPITLRPGTRITGVPGATILAFAGGGSFLRARGAIDIQLSGLVLDGGQHPLDAGQADALLTLEDCQHVSVVDMTLRNSRLHGISLRESSGRVSGCRIHHCTQAAIFSLDARGLEISGNIVQDCANNGILIWRSQTGEDGTIVTDNRIERIGAKAGGTGQNGNGINVFRAGSVLVANNHITDCAFSAVRGNAASNIQIVANNCARLGEVALYAEFGFEGAVINSNVVDTAAAGISITNFNVGGRLAVAQGNLIRNLFARTDGNEARGLGIAVEADAAITGNVIEGAPGVGISIGHGPYMRDVVVSGNLVRNAGIGISIAADPRAGAILVAQNMISGTVDGAIRAVKHDAPVGPDLVHATAPPVRNVTLSGNVGV
jgi:uncharacterized secreted repeat protein (TIGR03808 family)